MDENDRARYYREIAAAFFARRGAPFFLSPKDLGLVSAWERAGIPLSVVLEGVEAAFEAVRPGSLEPGAPAFRASRGVRPRGKVLALAYCEAAVARAWGRHRDRKVGGARRAPAPPDRRAAVREAIRAFLLAIPAELEAVRAIFVEAAAGMDAGALSDEDLERLDEKVEALLLAAAPAGEAAAARKDVRADHPGLSKAEADRAADVLLVKRLRAAHRIPYLAPFHHG